MTSERTPQDVLRDRRVLLERWAARPCEDFDPPATCQTNDGTGLWCDTCEARHQLHALDKAIAEAPDTLSEKPGLDVERLARAIHEATRKDTPGVRGPIAVEWRYLNSDERALRIARASDVVREYGSTDSEGR